MGVLIYIILMLKRQVDKTVEHIFLYYDISDRISLICFESKGFIK